jgi:signal peptidase I
MRNPVDRLTQNLPHPARVAVDWILTLAIAVAVVLTVKVEVANPYRIPSSSMEPTLQCAKPASGCEARFSDRVIANRLAYRFRDPHRGEIVVFTAPPAAASRCSEGGTFVKRLIGLPGEVVSERGGYVYVDGRKLDEPYIQQSRRDRETQSWPRIPKGQYFMMGDNRVDSCDSRQWGTVPRENLVGPVLVTYWPLDRLTFR